MQERLKYVPVRHEIVACHVDMGFEWVNRIFLSITSRRSRCPT
jgi:hypothetical protein